MNKNQALNLIAASMLAAFGTAAVAQDVDEYFLVGGSVGQSRSKLHLDRVASGVLGAGTSASSFQRDDRDTGYKLFGGYQFNRYFGLEAGYFTLGRFAFRSDLVPSGTLAGKVKTMGINVDAVGTLPFTSSFSAIGRIGGQYAKVRDTFYVTGSPLDVNDNVSKRALNFKVGLGLQYEASRSIFIRAEAERYRVTGPVTGHTGVNLYSVSLVFPLGRSAAAATQSAAPAYIAPVAQTAVEVTAPPAPPVAVPAPPPAAVVIAPPVLKSVTFSAESMFTFDNATVSEAGKRALDRFAAETNGLQFDSISVDGYADRLGSSEYNQTLSLQRADAVKSYLVSSGHIDPSRISTVGHSESTPVTQAADCVGSVATAILIACLQPDRRVEIQVMGKN